MKRAFLVCLFAGAAGYGCLPGDTRPEPGHVYITAEASAPSVEGFSTDDGWSIHFERLLVGLGNASLIGDACNTYANAGYDRLFDFTVPGNRKLGEMYGLAGCEIQFRLRPPSSDAILQPGVTAADREFMRLFEGPDPTDGPPPRTAVYTRGSATRAGVTKRFDWKFIARYTLTDCTNADGEKNTFVHLKAGDDLRPVISFHGEDLFLDGVGADALRRFDLVANADKDGDGNVTLDELEQAPAPVELGSGVEDAGIPDGGVVIGLSGLAAFMAVQLLPRMVHFDGNACQILPQPDRGGGGPF